MKKIINGFMTTFALCSRLPVPPAYKPEYVLVPFFLPVIGLMVLAVNLAVLFLSRLIIHDNFISAVFLLFLQYALFNLFHFDGLVDCCDAFFRHADRKK